MVVGYSVEKHGRSFPANVLAEKSGEHLYSVVASTDVDNGWLVAVGEYSMYDTFAQADVTTFTGKVVGKAVDGLWLVIVEDPGDACLVYTKPLSPYEDPDERADESALYNAKGEIMRAYGLHKHDRFEVSDECFNGTPKAGAEITGVANMKMTIA